MKKRFKYGMFTTLSVLLVIYTLGVLQVNLEGYLNGIADTILIGYILNLIIKEEI